MDEELEFGVGALMVELKFAKARKNGGLFL